jgi:O-antigen ligase
MFRTETYNPTANTWLAVALLGTVLVGLSFGTVHAPWIVTGAVLGAAVLAIALVAPLALVGIMLVIGPIDLSFMTGGFKSLFPQLGGLDMNGIRLLGATAGFTAYIMFEPRSRSAAWGSLGRPWLIFLAFAAATLPWSLDRVEGLRLLLKLAYPFLTFLIVLGVAASRERACKLMLWTLAAAVVYTVIVNPILALNGGTYVDYEGFRRVGGLGTGEAPYAFYVTPILMIVFARFVTRLQLRYFWFSLLLIGWIALTGTRIAALAALVGLLAIGLLAARSSGKKGILIGSLVAIVLAAVMLLPNLLARSFGFIPTPGELLQLVRDPIALFNSMNWHGRQFLWAIAWAAFLASPIIGRGLGSSTAVIQETFPAEGIRVPHNEYVRLLTDTGVLGVVLFLIAMMIWFRAALRLAKNQDPLVREFSFAAAAVLIGWLLIAITDNAIDYYSNLSQYLGFLLAAAVIVSADAEPKVTGDA